MTVGRSRLNWTKVGLKGGVTEGVEGVADLEFELD